ncbi:uncharacterized protein B0I36DRAFT_365712 [Microdochium trichocladiopsis]|uniref:ADP-ribosylation factor family-domain-containing protein n=1 Tax=Microdochium trichocladiopsis TaxID=1682393 RepID=A0A9P9BJZ2_9PEZI|nr:uncharacterized protein B0I36DRAFT_365712 [Microdochium trichocladiopsis]KAH7026094.1 hypothetical protein B0I36DRAFT_365712 [Microdochium trichocladiopsis]
MPSWQFLANLGTYIQTLPRKNRKQKICLFGADACGKTTLLYQLKLGRAVSTIPTIGFNVETVPWKTKKVIVVDDDDDEEGRKRDGSWRKGGQEGEEEEWEFEFWDVGGEYERAPTF